MNGRKQDKPLKLDIPFDDALRRLVRTSPAELAESIAAEKKARESVGKTSTQEAESSALGRSD